MQRKAFMRDICKHGEITRYLGRIFACTRETGKKHYQEVENRYK